MNHFAKISLLILAVTISGSLRAANFQVNCDGDMEKAIRGCTIHLIGSIETGDADRLRIAFKSPTPKGWHFNSLVLNSLGGEVSEAMELARIVKSAMLETSTINIQPPTSGARSFFPCVSACFLVWVAGTKRTVFNGYNDEYGHFGIGLHRPFFASNTYANPPNIVAERHAALMTSVREYLKREQVPEALIEKMMKRSSKEVYWLEEDDADYISEKAPWFEEMMISRCNYDPIFDRTMEEITVQKMQKNRHEKTYNETDKDLIKYLKWRQNQNSCEYEIKRTSQDVYRKKQPNP